MLPQDINSNDSMTNDTCIDSFNENHTSSRTNENHLAYTIFFDIYSRG